ncbi:MAG: hypothetical protein IH587_02615 [Anaerolineae bacterium]|nr:hypothetical protein [Anaerolineae bacterium]
MIAGITSTEAWALKRVMSRMDIPDDVSLSPTIRAIVSANGPRRQIIESMMQNDHGLRDAVLAIDPNSPAPDDTFDAGGRKPDDDDLALAFVAHLAHQFAYFYASWYRYDKGYWQPSAPESVALSAREFLRRFRSRGVSITATRITSVTKLASQDCYIPDSDINAQADVRSKYINLINGLYNLETHELEPHRPDLYFINQLPFPYDTKASRPTWLGRFLKSSIVNDQGKHDVEMAWFVIEALAYSMTARTDLQASFWVIGKPASGKSTLISLIRSLMGSLHVTIDLNQMGSNRFLLSGLVGKRAATFTESSAGTIIPDALFKTVVGGVDEVYADVKNKNAISFKPEAKIWWAMNEAPRTTDRSGALLRRLYPVLFPLTIPENQRIADLDRKLQTELPSIFNVLMQGYRRLQERGALQMPTASAAWLEDYKRRNDTELTFLEECALRTEGSEVQSSHLYAAYSAWCQDRGFKPKNFNQAAEDWQRLGLIKVKREFANFWRGVALK